MFRWCYAPRVHLGGLFYYYIVLTTLNAFAFSFFATSKIILASLGHTQMAVERGTPFYNSHKNSPIFRP